MITFTVRTNDPDEIVNWFTEQGHRAKWRSRNYSYVGIYNRWYMQFSDIYPGAGPASWNIRIKNKDLAVLFALAWSHERA